MVQKDKPSPFANPQTAAAPVTPARRVSSQSLLDGSNEIIIEHQGRDYRLRLTQNGKLILTA